jgi:hypothetical protein
MGNTLLPRLATIVFLLIAFLGAQLPPPDRTVEGHVLTSAHDPKIRVRLPASARYIGADRWVLYDMADCELHAFIDVDSKNYVQRLYWVQFEGYLPSRPELHHTYDSPNHASLGSMDFYVDSWVRAKNEPTRTGSDLEHIVNLIQAKGYRLPDGMMYVRFVHLLDEQKRRELMIIIAEDVEETGHTAADLQPGGPYHDQWRSIQAKLVERAKASFTLEP